jgi:polysaccharide pyruvyl transferase WcaK-like protein
VSLRERAGRRRSAPAVAPRIGVFGLLGAGNFGNDGSMEVVLTYLSTDHPDAIVDAMCSGSERVREQYGIDATQLFWSQKYEGQKSGVSSSALKAIGKGLDVFRTAAWVRRHDAVIVPGAGVLEATLPTRAWQMPWAVFLLCASGKLWGTDVALTSVGANVMRQRSTRWLQNSAARLASYRSYRDQVSLDAMRERGVTTDDPIYPDLVFGFPAPAASSGDPRSVGVGVMAFYGGNDDRQDAGGIHARYLDKMTTFVRWLADNGHQVRLLPGDSKVDDSVVQQVRADVLASRPDLAPGSIVAERVLSMGDLMREVGLVGTVVSTRYHNVLCALKLCKPTISIGYSEKHDELMADMGLSEFCLSTRTFDVDQLVERFTELERRSSELAQTLAERNATKTCELAHQFASLSSLLFAPGGAPVTPVTGPPGAAGSVGRRKVARRAQTSLR